MKKTILTLALLLGVANFQLSTFNFQLSTALAQDFLFEFADEQGTIIPDGTVVTVTKAEEADDGSGDIIMNSGIYVKNVDGDDDQLLRFNYEVLQKDNGDLQCCFPMNCNMLNLQQGTLPPGKLRSKLQAIDTEWYPFGYGTCVLKLRLESVVKAVGNEYVVIDDGPAITLRFVYADPAHVDGTGIRTATPIACYSLSGQRLSAQHRGLAVVRLSDGTVEKRILR